MKKLSNIANKMQLLMNQTYAMLMHVYALCELFWVQLYKMHAHYFCVFWVSSTQIGCNIRIAYVECMNLL